MARPRRRAKPMDRGERLPGAIGTNLLDRQFVADAPNKKRVADFTYIWTALCGGGVGSLLPPSCGLVDAELNEQWVGDRCLDDGDLETW